MKALLLTAALALSTTAGASCAFENVDNVRASMTTVQIDGKLYSVRGKLERSDFESMLLECGYTQAARSLRSWRAQRRGVNISAAVGLAVFPIALVYTPIGGVIAGAERRALVANIRAQR